MWNLQLAIIIIPTLPFTLVSYWLNQLTNKLVPYSKQNWWQIFSCRYIHVYPSSIVCYLCSIDPHKIGFIYNAHGELCLVLRAQLSELYFTVGGNYSIQVFGGRGMSNWKTLSFKWEHVWGKAWLYLSNG